MSAPEQPSDGDVLITSEAGLHFLSVVPHPHRLSFANLSRAIDMAHAWAKANGGRVWRTWNGTTERLDAKRSA